MSFLRRGDGQRQDPGRGVRQGAVTGTGVVGAAYRPARHGATWRGIIFLLVLAILVSGGIVYLAAPTFRSIATSLAQDNPQSLHLPFVADVVRNNLGDELTRPAGTGAAPIFFTIQTGQTVSAIGTALTQAGLIAEPMVFQYLVVTQGLDNKLQTGNFTLKMTMVPQQIVERLQQPPDPIPAEVVIPLRPGLRIEQIVALLEKMQVSPAPGTAPLNLDIPIFYQMATHPPADLLADYSFLKTLPTGRSLEGFLPTGVYSVSPNIAPEDLLRVFLDKWQATVGQALVDQVTKSGKDFYDILRLASIVERETGVDTERPKIAGVYTNRLTPKLNPTGLMNAEPTVVYANDTMKLRALNDVTTWPNFAFWELTGFADLSQVKVAPDLLGYQSWLTPGLPTTPIDSPTLASINAAIHPDTRGGYLYFYACPGSQTHVFAKTLAQQSQNIASCK